MINTDEIAKNSEKIVSKNYDKSPNAKDETSADFVATKKHFDNLRNRLFWVTCTLLAFQFISILAIFVLQGFKSFNFYLSDYVICSYIATTFANTLLIAKTMAQGLFNKNNKK